MVLEVFSNARKVLHNGNSEIAQSFSVADA